MAKKKKSLKNLPKSIEDAPLHLQSRLAAIATLRSQLAYAKSLLKGLDSLSGYLEAVRGIDCHVDECESAIDSHLGGKFGAKGLDEFLQDLCHDLGTTTFPLGPKEGTEDVPEWAEAIRLDTAQLMERLFAPLAEVAVAFDEVMLGVRDDLPSAGLLSCE